MIWLGIGVIVIGVALLILAFVLIKPLNNLASTLSSVQQTTDELPSKLNTITEQTTELLQNTNNTLSDLNVKMAELTPIFQIIGNAGRASEHFSSSVIHSTKSLKESTIEGEEFTQRAGLKGISGGIAFGYYLFEKRKALKNTIDQVKE